MLLSKPGKCDREKTAIVFDQMEMANNFLEAVDDDPRISVVHISIYFSLLYFWKKKNKDYPVSIFSREMMQKTKISGSATYHRCIRELHQYGYIQYLPSYNHFLGSLVYFIPLSTKKS